MAKPTGSKRKAAIVRKPAKSRACNHDTVAIAWHPETGQELSRRCSVTFGCGMQLSLGEANDMSADVQVEIRAAELECDRNNRRIGERWGWEEHEGGDDVTDNDIHWAGWLHRELTTHNDREARDVTAWPWDVTRPVAGQYDDAVVAALEAEQSAARGKRELERLQGIRDARIVAQTRHDVAASVARHADLTPVDPATKFSGLVHQMTVPVTRTGPTPVACGRCGTLAGCTEHRMYTCASCGKLRSWDDGAADDPDECSDCWGTRQRTIEATAPRLPGRVPYAEDQLPLPVVSDPCPDPETCSTCGDVPADLQDRPALPPLTPDDLAMESAIRAADDDLADGVLPATVDAELEAIGLVRFDVQTSHEIGDDCQHLGCIEDGSAYDDDDVGDARWLP